MAKAAAKAASSSSFSRGSLRKLRTKAGFESMSEFARACGVDRVTVWRWETGRRSMSAEMCLRVADVLDVDMQTVLEAL